MNRTNRTERNAALGIRAMALSAALLLGSGPAWSQSISGVSTTNNSSPLNVLEPNGAIIPPLAKFDTLSSVAVTASGPTGFTTRYISTNSTDSEALQPEWFQTLNSSYQVSFTVTAPGLYELAVDTALVGDLCLDDDNVFPPAGNWAEIFDVAGGYSGGALASGSLDITFPGGKQRINDTDFSFDPITSPFNKAQSATISGASFGVPQVHTLSFTWVQRSYTPGAGDPSTVRLGQESRLPDVSACTYSVPPRPQAPDGHWVTVTVSGVSGCGDGVVDPGEDCDEGASNGQPGSCCDGDCLFEPVGVVCRSTSAGDDCDIEETCSGSSADCPADGVAAAGTVCRAAAGACDLEETCDGVGAQCPADAKSTSECRAAADVCDVAESCDGVGDDCPADGFAAASLVCRAVAGACDVAETCTGSGPTCPVDAFVGSGVCRAAAGVCDVAEECSGSSATCPADDFVSGGVCRAAAGECDVAEECSGSAADCPADAFVANGTACTDDGAFCTGDETCQSGSCQSGGDPCSPASCDEGADMCLLDGCPMPPASGCLTSDKSIFLYKDKSNDSSDKLVYKWIRGQSTTQTALGDPTSTAGYDLCLYAGTTAALLFEAHVDPSATLWKPISTKGYKYKDSSGSSDGAQRLVLKASGSDKSKALWKGRGTNLPDLGSALPVGEFPIVVQLHNDQGSVCMESTFDAGDVRKNESDQLKMKDQ